MSTVPNARRSKVVDTTVTPAQWDSNPTITRSTVKESSFQGLSASSSSIHRSTLKGVVMQDTSMENNIASNSSDGNAIIRSDLSDCAVSNAWVKRCTFKDCVINNVRAHRSTARNSQLRDLNSFNSNNATDSVVQDQSYVSHSSLKKSAAREASNLRRSTLVGTAVSNSRLRRATLHDCDVTDCVISGTNFKGMILKYGVWKKGDLVGRIGDREVIAISKDSGVSHVHGPVPVLPELDSKSQLPRDSPPSYYAESDDNLDSDGAVSDDSVDLPPPYKV
ncbi:hypothetical protein N7474_004441 [Penicillium riverlandense]|uniref:uncharacterized protein n=1 Tax=Penicillium riverlandense TaxID=1903569 RepID=UPI002547A856|nr:uncharacterized protein N7474_004441 [Penicillium riverlandense]KAJ5818850.1 hypothetical protein N7474_004441 [Penicillium riverlandense]